MKILEDLDGLILSGGAARIGLSGELGNCAAFLELDIPILGICAGHQFMARHYGGDARESPEPEYGAMSIELVNGGGRFSPILLILKPFGKVTTTKFMSYQMVSSSQLLLIHVMFKEWKMKRGLVLDCNFTQR